MFARLVGGQIADVGLALLDEQHGPVVELLEIIGGVEQAVPLEAEPLHVLHDRIDVLGLFLGGVGVVEAQVALAAVLEGGAEVEADRLGMADVQIAVGLGRKARVHPAGELAGAVVLVDDGVNEIGWGRFARHGLALP